MDKLADGKDIENFEKIQKDVIKKSFDDGLFHLQIIHLSYINQGPS